jgi:hypothetical protein
MSESTRRYRGPAQPGRGTPQRRPTPLVSVAGGRAVRRQRGRAATARRHSPPELGLLALCAVSVALVAGLVTFTIVRDQAYLDLSAPLATPLRP